MKINQLSINQWISQKIQIDEFKLCAILTEVVEGYQLPASNEFERYTNTYAMLDRQLSPLELDLDFDRVNVFILLETPPRDFFVVFNQWLIDNCCNLSQIYLIAVGYSGLAEYWNQYLDLEKVKSFNLVETIDFPFDDRAVQEWFETAPEGTVKPRSRWGRNEWYQHFSQDRFDTIFETRKNSINTYFLYNGGTSRGSFESGHFKEYVVLKLLAFASIADIEFIGEFTDRHNLAFYLDKIHHWRSASTVTQLLKTYDLLVTNGRLHGMHLTRPGNSDLPEWSKIWQVNEQRYLQSWATVTRETLQLQPFNVVSEKTLIPFFFQQTVFPIEYMGVSNLENIGFRFDHDVIDYSYQCKSDPVARIQSLKETLDKLVNRMELPDLQSYVKKNKELYRHNADRVLEILGLI